jgi:hypothetical protein
MNESFSVNYENNQDKNEGIKENNSSFYDSEEQVKQSYLKYQQLE